MSKIEPSVDDSVSTYNIRPSLDQKFRSAPVKECIRLILMEELGDKSYRAEDVPVWTKSIADAIRDKIKGFSVLCGHSICNILLLTSACCFPFISKYNYLSSHIHSCSYLL
ncbi:tctex1 domain-containing protein 2-like isoform X2 [Limulus polyphemus]|uniref:Tctex1 domain-containing protein 2-like isoform X2 n=1 Tax=Limulus polyphemus TaxID=6850 RepID=A0ABM1S5K9_LIMPO|nr:tctex1 domain-containing protein 2-like isoform X2 [Limulus polyphemus]